MRQNFNRKCTRGDEELPSQVTAQPDLKLEEDAVFFHRLILLRVWPQLSGKLPADKQRHSQSGKALGKNESGWGSSTEHNQCQYGSQKAGQRLGAENDLNEALETWPMKPYPAAKMME